LIQNEITLENLKKMDASSTESLFSSRLQSACKHLKFLELEEMRTRFSAFVKSFQPVVHVPQTSVPRPVVPKPKPKDQDIETKWSPPVSAELPASVFIKFINKLHGDVLQALMKQHDVQILAIRKEDILIRGRKQKCKDFDNALTLHSVVKDCSILKQEIVIERKFWKIVNPAFAELRA